MTGLINSIFGSSPSVSTFTPTSVSTLNPGQTAAEQELLQAIGGNPSTTFPSYSGQLSAPLSGLQQTSLDAISNAVPGAGTAVSGAAPAQTTALNTLQNIQGATPQSLTGYYNSNVLQPLQTTFEQVTLPDIASALGGNQGGPQSTAAAQGVSLAANNFENTLASTQGNLALNTAQLQQQNALTAASNTPAVSASPLATLLQTLSAGAVPQTTQQTADTAATTQQTTTNTQTQQSLSDLLSLLGINTTTTTSPVVTPGQQGLVSSLLGNSGLGSSLGNFLFNSSAK